MDIKNKAGYDNLDAPFKIANDILNKDRKKCLDNGSETDIPIGERIKFVFGEYIKELRNSNIDCSSKTEDEIRNNMELAVNACKKYLSGDLYAAFENAEKILDKLEERIVDLPSETYLFRARSTSMYHTLARHEMFHIPFNKRYLVGNQRYSISGIPCLYLGQSTYICWEELGHPNPYTCNFIGVKTISEQKVLDMTIPQAFEGVNISIIPTILSCILYSRKDRVFKQEYILPQLIMQALLQKRKNIIGIKYHSTSLFYTDFPFVSDEKTLKSDIEKHNNYVFPALEEARGHKDRLSNHLVKIFHTTLAFSIWQQQLVTSKAYTPVSGVSNGLDNTINYIDHSIFGQLESIFAKNNYTSVRQNINSIFDTKLSKFSIGVDDVGAVSGEVPGTE